MTNKQRRGGLGRGLGALIPSAPVPGPADPAAPVSDAPVSDAPVSDAPVSDAPVSDAPVSDAPVDQQGPAGGTTVDSTPNPSNTPQSLAEAPAPSSLGAEAGSPADPPATELAAVPGAYFAEIAIGEIHANARQPRQVFDDDALAELTHSVREFGVLQPVVVRRDGDGYELVMGERRLRAATEAGLSAIPAIVRETADDAMLRDALLENIHRAQLNPLEEAAAYQQLLEEFGTTHEELARRIGRSRPQVSNTIRLLNLPIAVQRRVAAGVISAGHARALLSLDDHDAQDDLAGRIVAEGLSVRATEELVTLALRAGPDAAKPARTPARRFTAPKVEALAGRLSDAFDTRVRVEIGKRKGKITVEFATIDDLERIVGLMSPDVARRVDPDVQDGSGPAG